MNAQVTIYTGHIIVAAPFENQYVVSTDTGILFATALESGSGRRGGHIGGGAYMPGASVLVAVQDRTGETSTRVTFPNFILGAFNPYPTYEGTEFQPTEFVPETLADALRNEAYRRILENQQTTNLVNENRGANRPLDALPGDWFKSTVLGGCMLLSEFMTRVGNTPDCSISFSGLDKMAEIISHNFSADHGSQFRELIHRGLTPVDVCRFALRLDEGLGGSPVFESAEDEDNPSKLVAMDPEQTGFFRRELFQGGVEGFWDVFRTDDQSRNPHLFGEQIYPGMLSEMQRMDGIMRVRAAKEIRFEKTYGIVTPWMKRELRGAPPADELPVDDRVDIQFKQEELGLETEDEVSALRPLLHDYFANAEEEQLFFRGLRRDGDVWYFPTIEEVRQQVFGGQEEKLRVLGEQEQEYTLADVVSKDIEVYPGRKIRLFKNSSVFLMAEDGGVIIGDGYGAELRLNRGSLTIAAAGDLRVLPGRDLVEQVPGNRLSRVGKRVEVSSTDGAIVHKAHTNYHICSGGEDGGGLILENRSQPTDLAEIQEEALRLGQPYGSGIILKSLYSGTTILGSYLYGSAYAEGINSKKGVNEAGPACDILLNSGSGTLGLRGNNAVMSFRSSAALTMMEQATGLYLTQGNIMALAREEITAVTQGLIVDKSVGSVMRPVLTAAKIDISRKDLLPARAPVLEVAGSIQAKNSIATKDSLLAEDGVVSNQGANALPITDPEQRVRVKLNTEDATRPGRYRDIAITSAQISQTLLQRMIAEGVATQRGQKITELAFPDSASEAYRASNYELVAPRWQSMLQTQAKTWIEREVAHAILTKTYPYPGTSVYENGKPVIVNQGPEIVHKPMSEYKTNL